MLRETWASGQIARSKLREVLRVVTRETETWWRDFALQHNCREVERKVALSPRARAIGAQASEKPQMSFDTKVSSPRSGEPIAESAASSEQPSVQVHSDQNTTVPELPSCGSTGVPTEPAAPRDLVRLHLVFEAAEYAVLEAALDLIAAKTGGRRRERLLVEMAQRILQNTESRTRRRHAVVVERDANTGAATYVTDRGYLPASLPNLPASDGRVRRHRPRLRCASERQALERAGFLCERCGRPRQLRVHHRQPRCDGGSDDPTNLQVLCQACHTAEHAPDFAHDPRYIVGRARAIQSTRSDPV